MEASTEQTGSIRQAASRSNMLGNNGHAEITTTCLSRSGGDNRRIREESMSDPSDERKYLPPGSPSKEAYRLSTFQFSPLGNDPQNSKNVGEMAERGFSYDGKKTSCFSCGCEIELSSDDVFSSCQIHEPDCLMKAGTGYINIPLKMSGRKRFAEIWMEFELPESNDQDMQNGIADLQRSPLEDIGEGSVFDGLGTPTVPRIRDTCIRPPHVSGRIRLPSSPQGIESLNAALGFGEEPKSPNALLVPNNHGLLRRRSSTSIDEEEHAARFRSS